MTWVGSRLRRPIGATSGAAQRQRHRLGAEGEHRRLGLDPDQVAGIGPPPDHAARDVVAPQAQGLDEGHQGELGPHRVAARPGQHDEVGVRRAHVGPAAEREQRRVGAVPPVVAADDRRRREGRPVEGAPEAGGPRHRLGTDGGPAGRREAVDPAVELRGATSCRRAPNGRIRPAGPAPPRAGSARRRRPAGAPRPGRGSAAPCGRTRRTARRPRDRRASVAERGAHLVVGDAERPAPARRTARPASFAFASSRAARQDAASTAGTGATSASMRRSSMRRCVAPGRARRRGARRSPGGAPRARPRRRSGRRPTRAAPAGTGACRCGGSRAATGSAVTAAPPPTARRSTARARTATPCPAAAARRRGRRSRAGRPDRPPSGMATRSLVRGIQPGAKRGTSARQVPGVERERLGQGGARRRRQRLDVAHARPRPRRPAGRRARRPAGRRSRRCGRAGGTARARAASRTCRSVTRVVVVPLVVRAEQLARSEEERRRVLAAGGDDVVGGVLEPGPQPAGQAGVEARPGGGVAAQQRQDLASRATIRRRVTLAVRAGAAGVGRRGPSGQCAHGV